jgi:hypothetical protein
MIQSLYLVQLTFWSTCFSKELRSTLMKKNTLRTSQTMVVMTTPLPPLKTLTTILNALTKASKELLIDSLNFSFALTSAKMLPRKRLMQLIQNSTCLCKMTRGISTIYCSNSRTLILACASSCAETKRVYIKKELEMLY